MSTSLNANPRRGLGAFSLVELIAVITILGVVAAVAVPRWSASVSLRVADREAREAAGVIHRARDEAVGSGLWRSVLVQPVGTRESGYSVFRQREAGSETFDLEDSYTADVGIDGVTIRTRPGDVSVDGFAFDGWGRPRAMSAEHGGETAPRAEAEFFFVQGGHWRGVRVDPVSGVVSLEVGP